MNQEREFMRHVAIVTFLIAACAISQCSAAVHAQDLPVPDVTLPEVGETVALDAGSRAPWAGMLVRDEDLFGLQSALMTANLRLANAERLHAEVVAGRDRLLASAGAACDERVRLHDDLWTSRRDELAAALQEQRAEAAQWYNEPVLWTVIGAVLGGGLAGLVAGLAR